MANDLAAKFLKACEFDRRRLDAHIAATDKKYLGVPGYFNCYETPNDGVEFEAHRRKPIDLAVAECLRTTRATLQISAHDERCSEWADDADCCEHAKLRAALENLERVLSEGKK